MAVRLRLGVTSCRRLEQRVREDLGFRYLAGGAQPDFWTLNAFRQRHPQALNDLFTQVVELAREAGLGRLGHVAIDSTRVKANASPNRLDTPRQIVSKWRKRFCRARLPGLDEHPRGGRKARFSPQPRRSG